MNYYDKKSARAAADMDAFIRLMRRLFQSEHALIAASAVAGVILGSWVAHAVGVLG